ncbi:soluble lytic murein transglycosylase-like protein [Beggiatoa alba B18LD]|uniref:Soluble lytic murein transglycosylase-like protein n=1 Tax=Beggiatoa alba B18LD TaxID=395493 RepID=I3CIC5_9GAMM|nr:transglycosylase SLT domain-containing protein [Beggiatoa alba]EIJ43368.1 soluble lytic murein transglycosylase-like protein [Beggiatoa alba B18LD]
MRHWFKQAGFVIFSLINIPPVFAVNVVEQRLQFQQAYEAIQAKDNQRYQSLIAELQDYPIVQYLEYYWLSDHLNDNLKMQAFFGRYADSPVAPRLRRAWLNQLIKDKNWSQYLRAYTPQNNSLLACHYLNAVLTQQNALNAEQLSEAKNLWVVGKSQPNACDPVFKYLADKQEITKELRWQRIRNAIAENDFKLAQGIAKGLSKDELEWVNRWATMQANPTATLATFNYPDTPLTREIIRYGIKQLARTEADSAYQFWQTLKDRYQFSAEEQSDVAYTLALRSSWQESPNAITRLLAVNKASVDDTLRQVALQASLATLDWDSLLQLAPLYSPVDSDDNAWEYWQARAFAEQGNVQQAEAIYRKLAQHRDYYGFLSANQLKQPYALNDEPLNVSANELLALQKNLNIIKARELYYVGQEEFARLEWRLATENMTQAQLKVATALANQWSWYFETIVTAAKAKAFNALTARFPTPHYDAVIRYASEQDLNPAWVYAVIRQESAFNVNARSSANALGLMQLLPTTAAEQAKRLKVSFNNQAEIYQPELNIQLGTGYLRHLLGRLDNNVVLTTAAYNAGLSRARKWADKYGCLPTDVWIELIPFKETRSYVESIMSYTPIYEWRLLGNQTPTPMPLQAIEREGGC